MAGFIHPGISQTEILKSGLVENFIANSASDQFFLCQCEIKTVPEVIVTYYSDHWPRNIPRLENKLSHEQILQTKPYCADFKVAWATSSALYYDREIIVSAGQRIDEASVRLGVYSDKQVAGALFFYTWKFSNLRVVIWSTYGGIIDAVSLRRPSLRNLQIDP